MIFLQETYDEQQNLFTILSSFLADYSATNVLHVNQIQSCLDLSNRAMLNGARGSTSHM